MVVDSLDFNFSDFCGTPLPPAPDFWLPDTLCVGASTRTAKTHNVFADQREWHIEGPQVDTTIRDSLNISPNFAQPGQFKIGQKVWFLGCAYEHERIVTVLEPLKINVLPDGIACDGPPTELKTTSNRPISAFQWSTGSTAPTISVFDEKKYSLTATDGFCEAKGSADILFVSKIIGNQKPIALPADTVVCLQTLPFLLKPASPFANLFEMAGQNLPLDSAFLLKKGGSFEVRATIAGCPFSEKFNLATIDCQPKIYFPTVFSPNGDGLNDGFGPQGEGFEAVKLTVFDRWGNVWFEAAGPSPVWENEKSRPGVFTYLFEYIDRLDGSRRFVSGSVTVVK